jgi:hypothetical protein
LEILKFSSESRFAGMQKRGPGRRLLFIEEGARVANL